MIIHFQYYLLLELCAVLSSFAIGKIISSFIKSKSSFFFQLFYNQLIGILGIILCYAIIKSGGKTIFIALLPIVGILIYVFRSSFSKPKINFNSIWKELLWLVVLFTIIFTYQSWFFFDFSTGLCKSLYTDPYWYSTFSESQKLWGIENYFTSANYFITSSKPGLVPYHYPELWLTALTSNYFSISTIQSLYLIVYPLLISTFLIGICSVFETLIKNSLVVLGISLLVLFASGISFDFYNSTKLLQYATTISDVSVMGLFGIKYAFVYPYFLLGFILLFKKEIFLGTCIFSIIPFFSIGFLPAIAGGLILYYIYEYTYNKNKNAKAIAFTLLSIFCILLFYSINKSNFSNNFAFTYFQKRFFTNGTINFASVKAFLGNTIYYSIKITVIFFPTILLFFFNRKELKNLFLLCFTMIACGVFISSLYVGFTDGNQFANNILICLPIFQIIAISIVLKNYLEFKNKISLRLLVLCGFISIFTIYFNIKQRYKGTRWYKEDKLFILNASKQIIEKQTCVLVFLDAEGYAKNDFNAWHVHNDFYLATQYSSSDIIFTVGNPETYLKVNKLNAVDSFSYNYLTPLNVWNKTKGHTLQNFISNYKIKYLYFKAGIPIPDFISQNAKKTIKSNSTKSTFITLQ